MDFEYDWGIIKLIKGDIMERIQKTKRKKGFRPIGIFLFGMFFGLLFTLGAIAGVGFWAYNNLTLEKVEKITKSNIDVGNNSIKNKSIKELVNSVSGIINNLDTYTIEQIEEDFNIVIVGDGGFVANTLYGLDMTPLKKATKNTIKDTIQDIIGSATMQTVIENLNVGTDLGLFDTIMDSTVEYYFNTTDNTLYAKLDGSVYSEEVDSKLYEILEENTKIKMGTITYTIADGKISPQFRNIPIKQAFNDFDSVTKSLQIYKVLGYYEKNGSFYTDENCTEANKVTGLMSTIAGKTIDELDQDFVDNLTIKEVLDLTKNGEKYFDSEGNKVNGIINSIAEKTVKELSNNDTFNNIYIYEVMDYTLENGIYKDKSGNTITGTMKAIAGFTIAKLNTKIKTVKIADVLELDGTESGVLKFIFNNNSTIGSLATDIENLKLGEALGITENEATGIVRKFYATKVSGLNSLLSPDTLVVADAMGYYYNSSDSKYYKTFDGTNYRDEVTGVMATLAGKTLSNINTGIDEIKAVDIIDAESPILKLFDDTEKESLTVGNLSTQLVNKINDTNTTVGKLYQAGLITDVEMDETSTAWNMTIKQLIDAANTVGA